MLFSIQTYVEDYLKSRNIADIDGYSSKFARVYYYYRPTLENDNLLSKLSKIRTVLFRNNRMIEKQFIVLDLILQLDKRFQQNQIRSTKIPSSVPIEVRQFKNPQRMTIDNIVNLFKLSVEARGIDAFWESRKKGKLRAKPEKIAQSLLAVFCKGVLGAKGDVLREFVSGIGFVDAAIVISSTIHLVEIKMMTNALYGPEQLEEYMRIENKKRGTLLVFDALEPTNKKDTPPLLHVVSGLIRIVRVDINPYSPSSLNLPH